MDRHKMFFKELMEAQGHTGESPTPESLQLINDFAEEHYKNGSDDKEYDINQGL